MSLPSNCQNGVLHAFIDRLLHLRQPNRCWIDRDLIVPSNPIISFPTRWSCGALSHRICVCKVSINLSLDCTSYRHWQIRNLGHHPLLSVHLSYLARAGKPSGRTHHRKASIRGTRRNSGVKLKTALDLNCMKYQVAPQNTQRICAADRPCMSLDLATRLSSLEHRPCKIIPANKGVIFKPPTRL